MKKIILSIFISFNILFPNCLGDVNSDNSIDVVDVVNVVSHVLQTDSLNNVSFADINSDQLIDVLDVILIVSIILEGNSECEDGCDGAESCIDIHSVFKQFTELSIDSNGYYHFPYQPTGQSESDYGTVYYSTTDPITRVGWSSPDSFYVYHMGQIFWEPVINYSTYSGDDGEGQQLFYVNPTLIGDTLDIFGYYYHSPNIIDSVKVIIDD